MTSSLKKTEEQWMKEKEREKNKLLSALETKSWNIYNILAL